MPKIMFVGIDEVGRGPIAGPVCLCAFAFNGNGSKLTLRINQEKLKLADSKKLSAMQREQWFGIVKTWRQAGKCDYAISLIGAKTIDKIGIVPAINRAISNILTKLHPKTNCTILLDGGLRAPSQFQKQKTIVKGDEKEAVIALASIVAKVSRDRLMHRAAKLHPEYGFSSHVGYGTKAHYAAIKKHGLTPLHRTTFLTRIG